MIHQYKNNGYNIVMDVESGCIHVVDDIVYDLISALDEYCLTSRIRTVISEDEIKAVSYDDIRTYLTDKLAAYKEDEIKEAYDFVMENENRNENITTVPKDKVSKKQPDMEAQLSAAGAGTGSAAGSTSSAYDDLFVQAGQFVIDKDKASIGMLQRVFKIGFNRAARIMDQLCEAGVVGAEEGTKPRRVLMSPEQFESFIEESL